MPPRLSLSHLLLSESLGGISRLLEWLHLQEDTVVVDDVDHVGAEESSGCRLLLHVLNCEEWLVHEWLQGILLPVSNGITIEGLDTVNELLWIVHHLLILEQDQASLRNLHAVLWWRTKGLQLLDHLDF